MVILRTICWALLFILKLRFPPGQSLVDVLNNLIRQWFHVDSTLESDREFNKLQAGASILGNWLAFLPGE